MNEYRAATSEGQKIMDALLAKLKIFIADLARDYGNVIMEAPNLTGVVMVRQFECRCADEMIMALDWSGENIVIMTTDDVIVILNEDDFSTIEMIMDDKAWL